MDDGPTGDGVTRAWFVSDVHLVAEDDARGRLFLALLRRIRDDPSTTHLFLLGDVFDLWLADHQYFVERFPAVVEALQALGARGLELHYFEGNHDLHLERFWGRRLGMRVHPGPFQTELAGRRVRLEHGDQMDPEDRGYRFLRWFLRTPPIRFLLLHLPGSLIAKIGERASAHSRDYTTNRKTISPDGAVAKIRAHARKVHAERPFDLILSGHVHVRDDHCFGTARGEARSVNLGSWFDRPCAFLLDDRGGRFVELDVEAQVGPDSDPDAGRQVGPDSDPDVERPVKPDDGPDVERRPGDVAECAAPPEAETVRPP